MRITASVLLIATTMVIPVYAQTTNSQNSNAGVLGQAGNKSGPAMTKSGKSSATEKTPSPDQSKVPGLPGNKSGPAAQAPKQ